MLSQGHRTHTTLWEHSYTSGTLLGPNWLRGPRPFLLYKVLYSVHASPRAPCVAIQLYSAIQRYTLYSYTSLYTIQAIQHPSAPDWAGGHNGHGTIVTSKLKVRGKQPARPTHTTCSHKVLFSWASTTSLLLQLVAAGPSTRGTELSRSWRRLRRQSLTRGSTRPPCRRRPHLRAVQASHEPCRGSQAAEGPRRARRRRGLQGLRHAWNGALRSVLTWRQFGRDEGARALQGRLT